MDFRTQYCGLSLKNPLVASASPLTGELASVQKLEKAGVGAIVLPSLFEESVQADPGASTRYVDRIRQFKDALSVPVIGSLNGITEGGWLEQASRLETAGCDALELNVYYVAASVDESSDDIERRYIDLAYKLRAQIGIPVSMKLTFQFSSIAYLVKRLEETGIDGVVLFNRFYQPDIDLESLTIKPVLQLSNSGEVLMRTRWVAILRDQVKLSLAATGGFHSADDIIKALLAGADAVQLCSVLFQQGLDEVARLKDGLQAWMERKNFASVQSLQGILSYGNLKDPAGFERLNYLDVLDKGR